MGRRKALVIKIMEGGAMCRQLMRIAACGAILLVSCRPAADDPTKITVRDSLGVRVVHNDLDPGETGIALLPETPVVDLGVVDGAERPNEVFAGIAAVRTAGQMLVVADNSSMPVRVFTEQGRLVSAHTAQRGDGPGEFRAVGGAEIWSDTLVVWDPRLQRLSRFLLPELTFVGMSRLSPPFANPPHLLGLGPRGWLAFWNPIFDPGRGEYKRQSVILVRYTTRGVVVDTLGKWTYGRLGQLANQSMVTGPIFQSRSVVAVGEQSLVVGTGGARSITWLDPSGRPSQVSTWTGPSLTVREADRRAFLRNRLGVTEAADRSLYRKLAQETVFSDSFPSFDRLVISADGQVWVRSYRQPRQTGPDRWVVVARGGDVLGAVLVPAGFDVHEVGDGYVLGVERDSLDVEYVRKYTYAWEHR